MGGNYYLFKEGNQRVIRMPVNAFREWRTGNARIDLNEKLRQGLLKSLQEILGITG